MIKLLNICVHIVDKEKQEGQVSESQSQVNAREKMVIDHIHGLKIGHCEGKLL